MNVRLRRLHNSISALALAVGCAGLSPSAQARPQAAAGARVDLPSQALSSALDRIARATGARIRFDRGDASRMRSGAVRADDAATAIGQAIADTGLIVVGDAQSGFRVGRPNADGSDIVVIATRDEAETNYGVGQTSSSTRDGKDLRSQPQSTTVISSKLIADQQVQTVAEALRNASGATVNFGGVQGPGFVTTRGFLARPLSDGLVDPTGLVAPVATVERIEVLKGPAALLAGSDNLGGAVNIVLKKPSAQPLLDVVAEYGSYDDRRFVVDGSTALNASRTVSARLIVQHARADRNFGGYDGRFENVVYPAIRFRDSFVDVTVGMQASDLRQPLVPYGSFSLDGRLVDLSDRPVGPASQGIRVQSLRPFYDSKIEVADWLTVVSRGERSMAQTDLRVFGLAATIPPGSVFLRTNERQATGTWADDTYARFKFATFGANHTLSAGFNYSDSQTRVDSTTADGSFAIVPNLFVRPQPVANLPGFGPIDLYNYTSSARQYGYYAQDLVEAGPLHVLGAVRKTIYKSATFFPGRPASRQDASAVTPQFGIVLDVARPVSLYVNAMRGFIPNFLLDANNNQLPPQRSTNVEGGAKIVLAKDVLVATVSAFRLRQTNVPVGIPGRFNRYTATPGQQVKGIEIDATLQPTRFWQVVATYSHGDYDVLRPTRTQAVVPAQPRDRYSLFTKLTVPSGPLRDLGASVGLYGSSRSFLSQDGLYSLAPQKQLDANLYYRIGKVSLNAGVANLLDDTLYGVATTQTYVPRRPPRTFRLTLGYSAF